LIDDAPQSLRQALRMVKDSKVASIDGKTILIKADTICIHGDGPHAVEFAKALHNALVEQGIAIRAI